jgi:hypothetical protein
MTAWSVRFEMIVYYRYPVLLRLSEPISRRLVQFVGQSCFAFSACREALMAL